MAEVLPFNWGREITHNAQSFESQLLALKTASNESFDYKHSQMLVTLILVPKLLPLPSPYIKPKGFQVKPRSPF